MNKKYNKEDILETASTLLRKQGYHNTGINDIIKVCQIPKGSFYNFFENKEDFAVQLIQYYGAYMEQLMGSALEDQSKTPLQRLEQLYQNIVNMNQGEETKAGCLVGNMMSELGATHQQVAQATTTVFDAWTSKVAACVEEGQATGEITTRYTPQEIAEYLHTSINGAMIRAKATQKTDVLSLMQRMIIDSIKA